MIESTRIEDRASVAAQVEHMRRYFVTSSTLPVEARRQALMRLKATLKRNEERILAALHEDLGKSAFEAYATELGLVYEEINFCCKHMKTWARPRRVSTSIAHFPSSSKVLPAPYGVVLVLSPWNYPLQLALIPLIDAVAAGNCVAVKPSRTSRATGDLLVELIDEAFPSGHVCAFPGSAGMNDWLLDEKWDLVFFTGSPEVGRTVMAAAAEKLTPVVLELGGKSPCIVDASAHVRRAAQRIAWGKGINSGQTCVAPDYLLVHEEVLDEFVVELERSFKEYYGDDALRCAWWPHMINKRHFDRVMGLIEQRSSTSRLAFGGRGEAESLKIEPTCIVGASLDDPVMGEEIFGPVLPVITFSTLEDAFDIVRSFEKPLALYVFSESREVWERAVRELEFGGATINDTVVHLANNHMGFGGVGNSGMGSYHGEAGFKCFSHMKSMLRKGTWLEVPVRNPPFTEAKFKVLRLLMR